ncbi:UDP-GlcNAc:betaGal beta-1,3-N-acetylglucosaminyltransferase 9 [Aplochiton taeniatus]
MRRLQVKADLVCTLLLLALVCFLLYVHQGLHSSPWQQGQGTLWGLRVHGSTSANRGLRGAVAAGRAIPTGPKQRPSSPPDQQPPCKANPKPQSRSKSSQSKPKAPSKSKQSKGKSKGKGKEGGKKVATPTKASAALPTRPPFDFEQYMRQKDNRDFQLLIDQPEKCLVKREAGHRGRDGGPTSAPYLLIAVKSVAADFDKRQVVRRTWGREDVFHTGVTVRTVFLLGVPTNGSALPLWDRLLQYESSTYQDILLWDFQDTFFNLTLKETHFLQWVNDSCPGVRFIFKGDADVYVNVENILEMLRFQTMDRDLFVGDIIFHARPIRRRSSKYFVPESVYGAGVYPSYAGGGGFVMSGHTARRLSKACQQVEVFPIDDVFLGMCLQRIGVRPLRHQGFRTFGIVRPSAAPHLQVFDPCFYRELMVVHSLTPPQIWLMWNLLHDPALRCHARHAPTPWPFRWKYRLRASPAVGRGGEQEEPEEEPDYGRNVFVKH